MNRIVLLNHATDKVTNTEEYGTPEDNFQNIGDLWTTYLHCKFGSIAPEILPVDVALMMDLVKTARLIKTPRHADSWTDKAGYAACGAEVSNA